MVPDSVEGSGGKGGMGTGGCGGGGSGWADGGGGCGRGCGGGGGRTLGGLMPLKPKESLLEVSGMSTGLNPPCSFVSTVAKPDDSPVIGRKPPTGLKVEGKSQEMRFPFIALPNWSFFHPYLEIMAGDSLRAASSCIFFNLSNSLLSSFLIFFVFPPFLRFRCACFISIKRCDKRC